MSPNGHRAGSSAHALAGRRDFVTGGLRLALAAAAAGCLPRGLGPSSGQARGPAAPGARPVVSLVRVRGGDAAAAVEEAIELLGGIAAITAGKRRVLVKPNLVFDDPRATTRPAVVEAVVRLMKRAGKEVAIGEGSGGARGFNVVGAEIYRTRRRELLEGMQRHVFEVLGYTELARRLDVPLVNLHCGELVTVAVPGGLAYPELQLHRAVADADLLCSVPMMKTHALAGVTLGMKNLVGLYPGAAYGTVRALVHDHAAARGSPGVAYEILDMVRASPLGLTVVDGTTAMEGDGPTMGTLVDMGLVVAGRDPLATDLVAAAAMGFEPHEVPLFGCARQVGMGPASLDEIEVRGEPLGRVRRPFARPRMARWVDIRHFWASKEL